MIKIFKEKTQKMGIAWIEISGFKIKNFGDIADKVKYTHEARETETFKFNNELFEMKYSCTQVNNEKKIISKLKILPKEEPFETFGIEEIKSIFDSVKVILEKSDIIIDFSESKIKEIVLNLSFEKKFEDLQNVINLLKRANYKECFQHVGTRKTTKREDVDILGDVFFGILPTEQRKKYVGKTIKIYDFKNSINSRKKKSLKATSYPPLVGIDVTFGRDYYRESMKRIDKNNTLKDFLETPDLLENLFTNSLKKEMIEKPQRYIETSLKKHLEAKFLEFKKNEKVKRRERQKLKQLGEKIPEALREKRDIFSYLENESWVYDRQFIIEILIKHIEKKNLKTTLKSALKRFEKNNGFEEYNDFLQVVFPKKLNCTN